MATKKKSAAKKPTTKPAAAKPVAKKRAVAKKPATVAKKPVGKPSAKKATTVTPTVRPRKKGGVRFEAPPVVAVKRPKKPMKAEARDVTTCTTWLSLLGRTAEEPKLKRQLELAGATREHRIAQGERNLHEDIAGGMTLRFTDRKFFEHLQPAPVGTGNCLLTGLALHLKKYGGPLPFELAREATRDQLRARFGKPRQQEEFGTWDRWVMKDNLTLTASYTDDFRTLSYVLSLPERR